MTREPDLQLQTQVSSCLSFSVVWLYKERSLRFVNIITHGGEAAMYIRESINFHILDNRILLPHTEKL